MRVAVVGAGLTGLFSAVALARRGHDVAVIDRDGGPALDGSWDRTGVMQFHQPHVFRGQVVEALAAEVPDAYEQVLREGVETISPPEAPQVVIGMRCRRLVLESALWHTAAKEPRVAFASGHVDAICSQAKRVVGVEFDGVRIGADLVIDSSGRSGRLTDGIRSVAESSDCGLAYISRRYQLLPGAERGPLNMPFGYMIERDGYEALVFPEDNDLFTTLVLRTVSDRDLAQLRSVEAFDAAMRILPGCSAWTDTARSIPVGPVRPGAGLYNSYRGQFDDSGQLPLFGLVSLGDSVCTTNPAAARGVSTSLMQVRQFLTLLDHDPRNVTACVVALDDWCREQIQPWFVDQVAIDAARLRRWAGHDIDLGSPLSSDDICTAAQQSPEIEQITRGYYAMTALPTALQAVEPIAHAIYARGWRPPEPDGPSRDDLVSTIRQAGRI